MMIPIKVYDNMNNLKINNVNFEYGFKFTFVCNQKKLQVWQSKQSTYPCIHLVIIFVGTIFTNLEN
jgi:hypothetical protein